SNERNSRAKAKIRIELFTNKRECEKSRSTKNLDVHHMDENPFNNSLATFQPLCRSCYRKDQRQRTRTDCEKPHKASGYCETHYQRFKKYGDSHYTKYKISESEN